MKDFSEWPVGLRQRADPDTFKVLPNILDRRQLLRLRFRDAALSLHVLCGSKVLIVQPAAYGLVEIEVA